MSDELQAEVKRLRAELVASRAVSARALARSTRLAQLVSALGKLTDVTAILDSAVGEVAELFDADISAVLVPAPGGVSLAAQLGIGGRHLPPPVFAEPAGIAGLTAVRTVLAGPASRFELPGWLESGRPKHVAWGLLTVRNETLGYLLLARCGDQPFENADVQELVAAVSRISLAVDNGRLYRRTQDQLSRLQRLNEVTTDLAGMVDVAHAAQNIVETLVAHVPVSGAALYLSGADGQEPAAAAGLFSVQAPVLLELGAGIGSLHLYGAPAPGSDERTFLEHLADVGGLVLEKALLFERIRSQAETDALTGLPNRSSLLTRLTDDLRHCRQNGSDLAVVFIDLDGFKAINDTYGHEAGDELLMIAASRLDAVARPSGMAARLGGDEFVVTRPGVAADVDEIQRAVDKPYVLHLRSGTVEARAGGSIGVSLASTSHYDASLLLSNADSAMYAAKQDRRATAR